MNYTTLFVHLLLLAVSQLPLLTAVNAKRDVGIYYDNGFDQTVPLTSLKKRDRKRIEENVLNILGFSQRPQIERHPALYSEKQESNFEFLFAAYEMMQDQRGKRNMKNAGKVWRKLLQADSVFSVRPQIRKMNVTVENEVVLKNVIYFAMTNLTIPAGQLIKTADLRVYLRPRNNSVDIVNLIVYEVGANNVLKPVWFYEPTATDGWIDLNVSSTIINWYHNPSTNNGIVITARMQNDLEVDAEQVGLVTDSSDMLERKVWPFLLIFAQATNNAFSPRKHLDRRRRNADSQNIVEQTSVQTRPAYSATRQTTSNSCRMRNLRVDFDKLGWSNWVVAPAYYSANFCSGTCSYPNNQNTATNHAIVQTLLHVTYQKVYPLPSCAPQELEDTSFLYRDDTTSGIVMKKYKQMVVKSCSCQ